MLIPKVATTYLGGSVIFICTKADISMEIAWKTKFSFRSNNNTLNVDVDKIEYNNTLIQCFAKYPDQPKLFFSNESKILIQGIHNY